MEKLVKNVHNVVNEKEHDNGCQLLSIHDDDCLYPNKADADYTIKNSKFSAYRIKTEDGVENIVPFVQPLPGVNIINITGRQSCA